MAAEFTLWWVKFTSGKWSVASKDKDGDWFVLGNDMMFSESDFAEIGDQVVRPEKYAPPLPPQRRGMGRF